MCKNDHNKVHQGYIIIEGWVQRSTGRVLKWHVGDGILNTGRKEKLGNREVTDELLEEIKPYIEMGIKTENWGRVITTLRWEKQIITTKKHIQKFK